MSRKLLALSSAAVIKALRRAGFSVERIKGNHHHLRNPEKSGARVVVPVHRCDLPLGTLRAIIKQAGLTEEAFLELL